jgi:hypothetical protein
MFVGLAVIQSISLFRNFPSNPACGRVMNVVENLNVLINCDSAVFMKDAQNPSRFFNGDSVYQDRPLHALIAWGLGNFLKIIGFPNTSRLVEGNSGQTTLYESAFYLSYLILNFLILLIAVFVAIGYMKQNHLGASAKVSLNITLLIVLVVAANELTKSFFWTPHSQMFNVLLPVLALYLLANRENVHSFRTFFGITCGLVLLMFFYPLFGILLSILAFSGYSVFHRRIALICFPLVAFLAYPRTLEFFGGSYTNFNVLKFRQFVWVADSIKQNEFDERVFTNFKLFLSTFPIVPTILLVATIALIVYEANRAGRISLIVNRETLAYLLFFVVYLFTLFLMGYYSRRLTLGAFIFLEIYVIKTGIQNLALHLPKSRSVIINALICLQICSWIWSNGPLS